MGAFLVNVHVRNEDHGSLMEALRELPVDRGWITPAKNGWASVYEERASTQDDAWIRELGGSLSGKLDARTVAFLVHDSDFLCYWLFDRGELVDEFNSCPDYFNDDGGDRSVSTAVGRPELLLPFCRPGTRLRDIERILAQEPTFAESYLEELAPLLGIDLDRALTDYRDFDKGQADDSEAEFFGTEPPKSPKAPRGPAILRFPEGDAADADASEDEPIDDESAPPAGFLGRNMEKFLGFLRPAAPHDPLVAELVQAASEGNVSEIDRLVAAGVDIEGTAPLKLPKQESTPLVARMLQGGGLSIQVSPLLAAVAGKQLDAARRLIELGADVNAGHVIFGTPVHGAASGGAPELLRLLLDAGGGINEVNAQGQTPLQALLAFRAMANQLDQLRSLGAALPAGFLAQFEKLLPTEGWDECEGLLRERGGR